MSGLTERGLALESQCREWAARLSHDALNVSAHQYRDEADTIRALVDALQKVTSAASQEADSLRRIVARNADIAARNYQTLRVAINFALANTKTFFVADHLTGYQISADAIAKLLASVKPTREGA